MESAGTATTIIAEEQGRDKGEHHFPVAGRRTDSPRDILRIPANNSAAFRCVLTRPVADCHHSQITIVIIDCHEKVFRVSFLGWPFLHEKIYQLIPFRISDIMDDEAKKKEICTNPVLKFTEDEACLEKELRVAFPRVNCLELEIEHMTGKLVNES